MMIVDGVFNLKGEIVVSGNSKTNDNINHKIGDVLSDETKQWKVIAISKIHQGCFGFSSPTRMHLLKLEPINHLEQPKINDVLK
jgi:hypothetical protein